MLCILCISLEGKKDECRTSTVAGKLLSRTRQATLVAQPWSLAGSYPAWLWWGRIWGPGVWRHPTGGGKRILEKEAPVTSLPTVDKHCCSVELKDCYVEEIPVQVQLTVGCLWNGANHSSIFPPTLFFSCFFSFLPLKFSSWFCLLSTVKCVVLLFEVSTSLFTHFHVMPLREDQTS